MVAPKIPVTATSGVIQFESPIEGVCGSFDGVHAMRAMRELSCHEELTDGVMWRSSLQENDMVELLSSDFCLKPEIRGTKWTSFEKPTLGAWAFGTTTGLPLSMSPLESADAQGTFLGRFAIDEMKDFTLCVDYPNVVVKSGLVNLSHNPTMTERLFLDDRCEVICSSMSNADYYEASLLRSLNSENRRSTLDRLESVNPSLAGRIMHLRTLESGWDGYGGLPITEKASEKTAALLIVAAFLGERLDDPFIAPLPDGGLEIEWERDSRPELLVDVPPTGKSAEFLLEVPSDNGNGDGYDSIEGFIPSTGNGFEQLITTLMD